MISSRIILVSFSGGILFIFAVFVRFNQISDFKTVSMFQFFR